MNLIDLLKNPAVVFALSLVTVLPIITFSTSLEDHLSAKRMYHILPQKVQEKLGMPRFYDTLKSRTKEFYYLLPTFLGYNKGFDRAVKDSHIEKYRKALRTL